MSYTELNREATRVFGQIVLDWLEDTKTPRSTLARRADVPTSTVARLLHRKNLPGLPLFCNLCHAMGYKPSEVMKVLDPGRSGQGETTEERETKTMTLQARATVWKWKITVIPSEEIWQFKHTEIIELIEIVRLLAQENKVMLISTVV